VVVEERVRTYQTKKKKNKIKNTKIKKNTSKHYRSIESAIVR